MNYVIRHGRRIEVETLNTGRAKRRRKSFETKFVKVPARWIEALSQTKSVSTWRLTMVILAEAFKRKHLGGEIVLSSQVTRMPHATRYRATQELVRLGLIQRKPGSGREAPRVLTIQEC
jgi:hypothetical protein